MSTLEQSIKHQRKVLGGILLEPLQSLSEKLSLCLHDRKQIEDCLFSNCKLLHQCKYSYVLDANFKQLCSNMSKHAIDQSQFGRDRSQRPYMQHDFGQSHFHLSEAYISKNRRRPSITAVHSIRNQQQQIIGYLGVDFDLRELPGTAEKFEDEKIWQQIKGDPAIRGNLFTQQRIQSAMDNNIHNVFALMEELMCEYGVFHGKFHFSSSRTTIWFSDDPFNYHILTINELNDPDICLIYPKREYLERSIVPQQKIAEIFENFKQLRFADETIYLRSGSLNLVNGMVSLNFSCDGTHYLPYDEFLGKGMSFWFGDHINIDDIVETICEKGCQKVYADIERLQQGDYPVEVEHLSLQERQRVLQELVSIMKVYQSG